MAATRSRSHLPTRKEGETAHAYDLRLEAYTKQEALLQDDAGEPRNDDAAAHPPQREKRVTATTETKEPDSVDDVKREKQQATPRRARSFSLPRLAPPAPARRTLAPQVLSTMPGDLPSYDKDRVAQQASGRRDDRTEHDDPFVVDDKFYDVESLTPQERRRGGVTGSPSVAGCETYQDQDRSYGGVAASRGVAGRMPAQDQDRRLGDVAAPCGVVGRETNRTYHTPMHQDRRFGDVAAPRGVVGREASVPGSTVKTAARTDLPQLEDYVDDDEYPDYVIWKRSHMLHTRGTESDYRYFRAWLRRRLQYGHPDQVPHAYDTLIDQMDDEYQRMTTPPSSNQQPGGPQKEGSGRGNFPAERAPAHKISTPSPGPAPPPAPPSDPSSSDSDDDDRRRRDRRKKKSSRCRSPTPAASEAEEESQEDLRATRDAGKILLTEIKPYDGSGGAQRLIAFEDKIEEYQETIRHPQHILLRITVSKLQGDAHNLYKANKTEFPDPDDPMRIKNWPELKTALRDKFFPVDYEIDQYQTLLACTQKGKPIHTYNTIFNRHALPLQGRIEPRLISQAYFNGLDSQIRVSAIADTLHRSSLAYLQTLALRLDSAMGNDRKRKEKEKDRPAAANITNTDHRPAAQSNQRGGKTDRGRGGGRSSRGGRGGGRGGGNHGNRPYQPTGNHQAGGAGGDQPPQCRYCPQGTRHWHRECPRLQNLEQNRNRPAPQAHAANVDTDRATLGNDPDTGYPIAAAMLVGAFDADAGDDVSRIDDDEPDAYAYPVDARSHLETLTRARGRRGPPMDTGATQHMVPDGEWFTRCDRSRRQIRTAAKNARIAAEGEGIVLMESHVDKRIIRLDNVLHAPKLTMPLFSVLSSIRAGYDVIFAAHGKAYVCKEPPIDYSHLNPTMTGTLGPQFFHLDASPLKGTDHQWTEDAEAMPMAAIAPTPSTTETDYAHWHARLGHLGIGNMRILQKLASGAITRANFQDPALFCDPCVMGKIRRIPHPSSTSTHQLGTYASVDYTGPFPFGINGEIYVGAYVEYNS